MGRTMSLEEFEHAIASPSLRSIVRHWAEVRRGKRMPGWNDLRPSELKAQLSIIWSWKYDRASGEFTGRLAGERIQAVFGTNFRGAKMADAFARFDYEKAFKRHTRVVNEPGMFRGHGLVFHHLDRFDIGERIILPLADDGETGDGIFGATEFQSNFGAPPEEAPTREAEEWFTLE